MRISGKYTMPEVKTDYSDLLTGRVPKLAVKQVDQVRDLRTEAVKENHRVSFKYDKDLGRNVAEIVDNATGKIVRQLPSPTQVDHMKRLKQLMGLFVDEKA